jgi:tetratricopeptide (TPR) repeat protein
MARQVAVGAALADELLEAVATRADGVPLFIEELVKVVVETDPTAAAKEIPATLADSLMARLDRLGPAKEVAQVAAVLGREFGYPLLRAVSPLPDEGLQDALETLAGAELLYARGLPPDATYLFKHALVQETAYQSLLRARRRELHRRVAEILAERFPDVAAERPELLAQHWTAAGEADTAVAAWQRAGELTLGRGAYAEAASHVHRGLDVLGGLPDTDERARRELTLQVLFGQTLMVTKGYSSPQMEAAFARARELGTRIGDMQQLAAVLLGLSAAALTRAALRTAGALADEMLRVAETAGDPAGRVWAHASRGMAAQYAGDIERAEVDLSRSLALGEGLPGPWVPYDPCVPTLGSKALTVCYRGRADEARRLVEESFARAHGSSNPFDLVWAHTNAGMIYRDLRDPRAAAHAEAMVELSTEHGFDLFVAFGLQLRGIALAWSGDCRGGARAVRDGIARARASGFVLFTGFTLGILAELLLRGGAIDEAHETVEEAIAAVGEDVLAMPLLLATRALVLAHAGAEPATVEVTYREAIAVARRMGAKTYELRATTWFAGFLHDHGRAAEARALLAPLYASFTEGFDTRDLVEAKALLEELG